MYFGTLCYGYALSCLFVYLVIHGTRPLFKKKAKVFLFFFCMQPRKMKFSFVQINMEQVSYSGARNLGMSLNLLPYSVYVPSNGSGTTARLCRLI